MRTRLILFVASVMTLLPYSPTLAQSGPGERLESGIYMEEVTGDLEGAIAVFEEIVAEASADRALVARALLHIGSSYEKLGNLRAESAYQRVIDEFGDQETLASEARMRLQNIKIKELTRGMETRDRTPSYQMVFDADVPVARPMTGRQYEFSPHGDRIVYQGSDGIYLVDATGTPRRPLVLEGDKEDKWFISYFRTGHPRWSPDGQRIAYFGSRPAPPGDDPDNQEYAIFVVDPDAGTPRRVGESLNPEPYGGLCWTPDGKNLAYLSLDGVEILDLQGQTVGRIALERHHPSTRLSGYSPDGRWLTLELKADLESQNAYDTDLYLLPADGGDLVPLTTAPGYDAMPEWSPDSRAVYFMSNRGDNPRSSNIWKVEIDPLTGTPGDEPEQVTFFEDAKVMHPQIVGDGRRLAFTLSKTTKTINVAPAGQPEDSRALVRGTKPTLSRDGKTVYYVGEGPDQQGIHAITADGRASRRLTNTTPASEQTDLSPDGKTLAYFMDKDDKRGLFILPVDGGEPRRLLTMDCEDCCKSVFWSPEGRWLIYTSGDGLYRIPSTGGEPQKLATLHGWESWTLRWSPNGQYIAALAYQESGAGNRICVVPAAGGDPKILASPDEHMEGLEWHPDGKSLTYHLSKTGSETYRSWLDDRPPELFLNRPGYWDYLGCWSPDGKLFYLLSFKDNVAHVDAYDPASGKYTPFAKDAGLPRWSADQSTVVWTTQTRTAQLWLMTDFK